MAATGEITTPQKMEVDYSSTVDEKVPKCEKLAKQGKLNEALDVLLALEKQTRTASDTHSTSRILVTIVKLCFETKNWDALNENIVLLTKKRSQIKQSVTKMIQEACTYVDKTPNLDTKLKLIDTLRTVTAGKVETFGSMEKKEKELKLKYYQLMIELDEHEGSYLAICKHYRAVYDTPEIKENKDKMREALRYVVLYMILAPYDNEQSDLIHRIKEDRNLEEIPKYRELLKCFTTTEIIHWKQLCNTYESELKFGSTNGPATHVFNTKLEGGAKRWTDLKNRVVEHNIRVMAKYYTRVHTKRMAELLDLTESETEEFLSSLVTNKTVQAKMDRLEGIINFTQQKDPNDILNDWSYNINTLMQLVNKTNHLITKEEMVHKLH
ncbi:hypothetical protein KUTeg_003984 [Tegillarca granosa]|uniref:PCI domain-containing protein n=1 Tax=Tegillarca granosa TaxID=220873 RepID=A0ABQ9FNR3_TEGGR|nr:hypothetical protein KUTeg_003984 [Tegillarca granosa]